MIFKMIERARSRCQRVNEFCEPFTKLGTLFLLFAGAFVALFWFLVQPRIERVKFDAMSAATNAVLSRQVLEDVGKKLRPYAVIAASIQRRQASFKYDAGALDLIDSASLIQGDSKATAILTLKMKQFVQVAPLVRPLTPSVYIHSFWETNKFDWAYELRSAFTTREVNGVPTGSIESEFGTGTDYTFLVELLTR